MFHDKKSVWVTVKLSMHVELTEQPTLFIWQGCLPLRLSTELFLNIQFRYFRFIKLHLLLLYFFTKSVRYLYGCFLYFYSEAIWK